MMAQTDPADDAGKRVAQVTQTQTMLGGSAQSSEATSGHCGRRGRSRPRGWRTDRGSAEHGLRLWSQIAAARRPICSISGRRRVVVRRNTSSTTRPRRATATAARCRCSLS